MLSSLKNLSPKNDQSNHLFIYIWIFFINSSALFIGNLGFLQHLGGISEIPPKPKCH